MSLPGPVGAGTRILRYQLSVSSWWSVSLTRVHEMRGGQIRPTESEALASGLFDRDFDRRGQVDRMADFMFRGDSECCVVLAFCRVISIMQIPCTPLYPLYLSLFKNGCA